MLFGMLLDIFELDEWKIKINNYKFFAANTYRLQVVRFACAIAMHLILYPEVDKGMKIMKFSNNHFEMFNSPNLAFLVGYMQFFTSIFAEFINIWLLGH